jgi:hypothetical protein
MMWSEFSFCNTASVRCDYFEYYTNANVYRCLFCACICPLVGRSLKQLMRRLLRPSITSIVCSVAIGTGVGQQ